MTDSNDPRPRREAHDQTAEKEPVSTEDARQADIVLDRPAKRWLFAAVLVAAIAAVIVVGFVLG